jgi:hypothetical protein
MRNSSVVLAVAAVTLLSTACSAPRDNALKVDSVRLDSVQVAPASMPVAKAEMIEPGSEFLGAWVNPRSSQFKMVITKDGDLFVMDFVGLNGHYTFTLADGRLKGSGMTGDVTYGAQTHKLHFGDRDYIKME